MNYGGRGIIDKKKLLNSSATKLETKLGVFCVKILLIFAIAIVVGGSCLVFGAFQGIIESAPDISTIDVSPNGYATKVYDCNGEEIQTLASSGANRTYVTLDQIPVELQEAFVAIEDERFYEHNGIDVKGIIRAAAIAVTNGGLSQGASTITQQLLKNNVFNAYNETTIEKIKRKIQEQYLAVKLETVMSKDDILENYLNTINLGNGYYGVQAAAEGYFNKDVSELTLSECAVIASITKNPQGLNPINYPDKNRSRQIQVLSNMLEQGYITQAQYDDAVADDVYARLEGLTITTSSSTYSYFVDEVIEQLTDDLMEQYGYTETQASNLIYGGGLQIYTTQDTDMQEIADDIINDTSNWPSSTQFSINLSFTVKETDGTYHYYSHSTMYTWFTQTKGDSSFSLTQTSEDKANSLIKEYEEAMLADGGTLSYESIDFVIQPQVSFSMIEQSTGYVKVLVGGRGDKTGNRTLNRATDDVTRQPGSSIKPLVAYGPALDTGAITLATAIDDAPYYYSGSDSKLVTNYDKSYRGLMTVREAITISENVPAVKVLTLITPQVGYNYLEQFGISTLVSPSNAINGNHDVVQSLALGGMTRGVCNIDMTAAYAAIANGGVYTEPIYYTQVLDSEGNVLIDNTTTNTHRVLKETTAWLLTSALRSVVTNGTATAANFSGQPVCGKTGTTQNDTDKWFCGYTPYYAASIWVGYDDNSTKVNNVNHTRIWGKIMSAINDYTGDAEGSYQQPDGIVQAEVCNKSGDLPSDLCSQDERGSTIISEYFSEDNVPTETCSTHVKVTICNDSGAVAVAGCTSTTTRILTLKESITTPLGASDDASNYTTADAAYSITAAQLTNFCTIHSNTATTTNSSGTSTGTSSSSTSSSGTNTQQETKSSEEESSTEETTTKKSSSSSSSNSSNRSNNSANSSNN